MSPTQTTALAALRAGGGSLRATSTNGVVYAPDGSTINGNTLRALCRAGIVRRVADGDAWRFELVAR